MYQDDAGAFVAVPVIPEGDGDEDRHSSSCFPSYSWSQVASGGERIARKWKDLRLF